jgi:two-component sensor histidine kinase
VITVLYSNCFEAQTITTCSKKQLTEKEGLPSNEVYSALEDHFGYIWFATDYGIAKYNGYTFEVFNTSNGLPETTVFKLYLQRDSSIIGECINNQYFRIKNNQVSLLKIQDSIDHHIPTVRMTQSFYVDQQNHTHIGTRDGYYEFAPSGELVFADTVKHGGTRRIIIKRIEQHIFAYAIKTQAYFDSLHLEISGFDKWNGLYGIPLPDESHMTRSVYVDICDDFLALNSSHSLHIVSDDGLQSIPLNNSPVGVTIWDKKIIVPTLEDGFLVYQNGNDGFEFQSSILPNSSATSSLQSKDGNFLFLNTTSEGITQFNIGGPKIVFKSPPNENITACHIQKDTVLLGCESGRLYYNDTSFVLPQGNKIQSLQQLEGRLIINSTPSYYVNFKDSDSMLTRIETHLGSKVVLGTIDGIFYQLGYMALYAFNHSTQEIYLAKDSGPDKMETAILDNSKIITSSVNGYTIYHLDSLTIASSVATSSKIVKFFYFEQTLYGVTAESIIHNIHQETIPPVKLPLLDKEIRVFDAFYEDELLHLATNLGVYSWSLAQPFEMSTLINFEPIHSIRGVSVSQDTLFFHTKKTLFKKAIQDFSVDLPSLQVQSILSNGKEIEQGAIITLPYTSRNIKFNLNATSFSDGLKHFKFQLVNHDKDWIYTSENNIAYNSLEPGSYTFIVSASADGYNYSEEIRIEIIINAPFWQTWWFYLSLALIVFGVAFLFFRWRIKQERKKTNIEKTISQLRSKALIAQLNPHLIFNVLNTIQGIVSEGEIDKANSYVAKFSKFMRASLKMSKHYLVPISEEINMTEIYLQLEKLRFGDEVSFKITKDLKGDQAMVPPLIIQPLVENAIKHGVMPVLSSKGEIEIVITDLENHLSIRVIDNGIGFTTPIIYGDGLMISEQRIKSISPENELLIINEKAPCIVELKIYR